MKVTVYLKKSSPEASNICFRVRDKNVDIKVVSPLEVQDKYWDSDTLSYKRTTAVPAAEQKRLPEQIASIISGTPRSVSGTISDLNNNYANQQYILLSKNIHTIYFNNSTAPLNTVIIITFIKVIRSYLVYIIIQPVSI